MVYYHNSCCSPKSYRYALCSKRLSECFFKADWPDERNDQSINGIVNHIH